MPERAQGPRARDRSPNSSENQGAAAKNCDLKAGNPVPRRGVFSMWRPCRPPLANDEGAEAMNQQNNNQNPSQQQREQQQREQQNQQNQGQKPGQPGQKPGGQHSDRDDHNK